MITGAHAVIRSAEPDDAPTFVSLADPEFPRLIFLDHRREIYTPTRDEISEMLRSKVVKQGMFYSIEDLEGRVRGFCSLKTPAPDAFYSEILCGFFDDADFDGALADEMLGFLARTAFIERKLNKILAQVLDNERGLRGLLERWGFESDGVQREMVFAMGRYLSIETLTLRRETYEARHPAGSESDNE